MKVTRTDLPEVLIVQPRVHQDDRGFFLESFNQRVFAEATGVATTFVQDNHSCSRLGVLRGLHYQIQHAQGKLVRVLVGEIWDVVVDMRRSSPTFGRWVGLSLTAASRAMLWIPPGFAHGFLATSDGAEMLYKTTDYYAPEHERTVRWNDPDLRIEWPLQGNPILAPKDAQGLLLTQADTYP